MRWIDNDGPCMKCGDIKDVNYARCPSCHRCRRCVDDSFTGHAAGCKL